ncbi:RNA-directed DNA polymerase from transposon BS, partial [Paramuricea clavata]
KKRENGDRIREVENGSTTGGASGETTVVYKRLAELLANKRKSPYNTTLAWMRCHISFALMKSTISCIRGSRVRRRRHTDMGIATEVAESNLIINP